MTVRIKDRDGIKKILPELEYLASHRVEIGIFGDDDSHLLMIARVHEFGVRITVTPAMRGWFRWQGYPLSPETTEIHIPERSFMRSTFDREQDTLVATLEALYDQVLSGEINGETMLGRVGEWFKGRVQHSIRYMTDPPLSAMTIERKQSSGPLRDTGRLSQSVTWRVVPAR